MKKIRIIDADALKANMFDYAPPEMVWDKGDIEHKIDEMPIVEAIPFEWFYEQFYKHPESLEARFYDLVLKDYLKDQEEENKNGNMWNL